ncbi:ATP-binding protein [Fusibacter tunisiensis]|uniref:Uncharacterized protein YhaN n=1 Tax=Fusibacter tunisiensis TaxID=1008308 RepID=A0ABS2MSB6_9FIRM|nr:AAA family ATPase [Fusibacter tunisiensis]MBM7562316.1 uncharacterized protein YhaN [Fusibacter tunisiensis]
MQINWIHYKHYGKLQNRRFDFEPGLNVFCGENEAGKSTLFHSVVDLIYGFEPANRDQNLYTSWNENRIEFNSEIFQNGELFHVMRRLKSTPKFTITDNLSQQAKVGRNESLPWVDTVGRKLYTNVFHITAEALNSFDSTSWQEIQDRLIGTFGLDYLNRPTEVLSELDKEINGLWRKDRKGAPKLNKLMHQKSDLEHEIRVSKKAYIDLNKREADLEEKKEILKQKITEKRNQTEKHKLYRILLPVKAIMDQMTSIRKESLNLNYQGHLLDDYQACARQIDALKDQVSESKAASQLILGKCDNFSDRDRLVLNSLDVIKRLESSVKKQDVLEQEEHELSSKLLEIWSEMERQFQLVLNQSPSKKLMESVLKIHPFEVKNDVQTIIDYEKRNAYIELGHKNNKKLKVILGVSCLITGGFLVGTPHSLNGLTWLGMILLGISLPNIYGAFTRNKEALIDTSTLKTQVLSKMNGFNIPDYVWTDASFVFFLKLEQLSGLCVTYNQLSGQLEHVKANTKQVCEDMITSLTQLGIQSEGNIKLSAQMVLMDFERLENRAIVQKQVDLELEASRRETQKLESRILELASNCQKLRHQIASYGDGDFKRGYSLVETYYDNQKILRHYEMELADKSDAIREIKALKNETLLSTKGIIELEIEIEHLEGQIQDLMLEINSETLAIEHEKTNYDILGVSEDLQKTLETIEVTKEKRDVLMLSRTFLEYADITFRSENQPEIIQKVSAYLDTMTNGKYKRILLDETSRELSLFFQMDGDLVPLTMAFSKGTLNQLFLAFRLAVIDSMDPNGNLPIVLDEALINWDSDRLKSTVSVLKEVSKNRQVILTTCHDWMAKIIESISGTTWIKL